MLCSGSRVKERAPGTHVHQRHHPQPWRCAWRADHKGCLDLFAQLKAITGRISPLKGPVMSCLFHNIREPRKALSKPSPMLWICSYATNVAASRCAHLPLVLCSCLVVFTSSAFLPVFSSFRCWHTLCLEMQIFLSTLGLIPPFPGDRRCAGPGRPHSSQRRSWLPVLAGYGWKMLMLLYIHNKKKSVLILSKSPPSAVG